MPEIPHEWWVAWLLTGLAFLILWGVIWFGILEGMAIANKFGGDTLSEVSWDHGNIPAVVYIVCGSAVGGGLFWLIRHLAYRIR